MGNVQSNFPLARRLMVRYTVAKFCRKVAGWLSAGGTDIVRELTGSVKPRTRADAPIPRKKGEVT